MSAPPLPTPMRSRDLSLRFAAGDKAAEQEVYDVYRDQVYSMVYRILGGDPAAQDVTHDAFLKAFVRAREYRSESDVGTWIVRIAINLALMHLRGVKRYLNFARHSPPTIARPVSAAALDIDRALISLPTRLRVPFVLRVLEDQTYLETATQLSISELACRQRVHRAREILARALSDYRESEE